jgi:hypothetical protein
MGDGNIKVERDGGQPTKGRAFSALTFHRLHSFVTHLANSGVDDEMRMKLTGHTNSKVHEQRRASRYRPQSPRHPAQDDSKRAPAGWRELGGIRGRALIVRAWQ